MEQGIAIEFTADPQSSECETQEPARTSTSSSKSLTQIPELRSKVSVSRRGSAFARETKPRTPAQCREKIQSYLTGSMRARPDVDLNSYYILALNKSPDISVIDPLLGFGGSKL